MILWKGMWNSHKAGEHPVKKYVKWTNLWNTLWIKVWKKIGPRGAAAYKLKGMIARVSAILSWKGMWNNHKAAGEHHVIKYMKWTFNPRK